MNLGMGKILEIVLAAIPREEDVVLPPENDGLRLLPSKERLPVRVQLYIRPVVIEEVELDPSRVGTISPPGAPPTPSPATISLPRLIATPPGDWPSFHNTFAYLPDLDTAKKTAIDLVNAGVKPLLAAQTNDCRVAVHALCHSMGAYVLREALDHADDGIETGTDWMLNQLVMIAGDVDAADFVDGNKDTQSMLGHAYRLTNYFNRYDEVLQISNVKHGGVEPRAGRVGLPDDAPANTVNVDCSAHFATIRRPGDDPIAAATLSHCWYFTDATFYNDLAETLRGAVDRKVIADRGISAGKTLSLRV